MLVWKKRTNAGRVVYNRKKHFFTVGRLARAASGLVNREPVAQQPDENYFGWLALAKISAMATKTIGARWGEVEIGKTVRARRLEHNAAAILALRDFIRGMRKAIGFMAQWAGWCPYVGDVLAIGIPVMDIFINAAEINMPVITIDPETGQDVIHW